MVNALIHMNASQPTEDIHELECTSTKLMQANQNGNLGVFWECRFGHAELHGWWVTGSFFHIKRIPNWLPNRPNPLFRVSELGRVVVPTIFVADRAEHGLGRRPKVDLMLQSD